MAANFRELLPRLVRHDVRFILIGGGAAIALAGLRQLGSLSLTGTRVTDSGVAHLRGHESLCRLEVRDTLVSEDEKMRLKEQSPCRMMTVIL